MPSKIQSRGNNQYRLTVSAGCDGNGKQLLHRKTVTAANITEAKKLYIQFAAEVARGQVATDGGMTLSDFYDYWKKNHAEHHHAVTTREFNDQTFKRIKEALGHIRIGKLAPKHLLAFYKNLSAVGIKKHQKRKDGKKPPPAGLSPVTIRNHHALLSTLLASAVKWNLIHSNPCERVEPPKNTISHKFIYDKATLGLFLTALESEPVKQQLLILLALTGGLRREEIFGLEWKHVDFENGSVSIKQASVYVPGPGTFKKDPKNYSSRRTVSLPDSVMALLLRHQAEQNEIEMALDDKWHKSDRIFTQWDGKPGHPHSFNGWLRRFCDRHKFPRISPHALRHMSATFLISAGVDVRTVSGKLGHSRVGTTLDIYSHFVTDAEKKTAATMEEFMTATKTKPKKDATSEEKTADFDDKAQN